MSFIKKKKQIRFEPAAFEESTSYLQNPSCGWYRIYPFAIEEKPDFEELYWCLCAEESIALVLADIGAYRSLDLPKDALGNLAAILEFFAGHGKEIILRVTYDREGRGMEREPDFLNTVIGHMRQLGAVIRNFREQILLVQGMLVGSWGEMHDSKFLSEERLRQLMSVWREAVGGIAVAVRTPQQWRLLHTEGAAPGADKIGIFNDGMFGSPDHLGTFGWQKRADAGWSGQWRREEEMEFIAEIASSVPYGGEAVGESLELPFEEMVREMRRTHVSYLNSVHDARRLDQWKKAKWEGPGIWQGKSVYDYIGCRLGYRFVIREARLEGRKEPSLKICIENIGFSPLQEEAELLLCTHAQTGESGRYALPGRLCGVMPQDRVEITAELPGELKGYSGALSLALRRKRDKRPLLFANVPAEDGRIMLGQCSSG